MFGNYRHDEYLWSAGPHRTPPHLCPRRIGAVVEDAAEDAVDKVSKNKEAKAAVDKAINEVEKKVKVDLPDVDTIAKTLKK